MPKNQQGTGSSKVSLRGPGVGGGVSQKMSNSKSIMHPGKGGGTTVSNASKGGRKK